MRIGLVYLRPRLVAYIRRRGPFGACSVAACEALADWLVRAKLRPHASCTYGLIVEAADRNAADSCRYDACVEIPADFLHLPTDGVAFQTLPGGTFARARHVGSHEGIRSAFSVVRDGWLTSQGHIAVDERRPLLSIFVGDPTGLPAGKLKTDICVPVRLTCDEAARPQQAARGSGPAVVH